MSLSVIYFSNFLFSLTSRSLIIGDDTMIGLHSLGLGTWGCTLFNGISLASKCSCCTLLIVASIFHKSLSLALTSLLHFFIKIMSVTPSKAMALLLES